MSEDDNIAVARRWIDRFNDRSGVAEFLSLLAPDVEMRTPGGPHLRGHEEARAWFEKRPESVRSRIVADRFVARGDTVVALGRTEARWIGSDEVADVSESAAVYWFRDGKVSRWQPFESHTAALEAAGFEE